jgi:hypothetical protein
LTPNITHPFFFQQAEKYCLQQTLQFNPQNCRFADFFPKQEMWCLVKAFEAAESLSQQAAKSPSQAFYLSHQKTPLSASYFSVQFVQVLHKQEGVEFRGELSNMM